MAQENKSDEDNGILVYSDALVSALLQTKGAVLGHVKIFPKKPYKSLREMPDEEVKQLFFTATSAASAVFEQFSAQGTNIILNENNKDPVCVHVIPRKMDDGLNFQWQPKQMDEAAITSVFESLKDKAFYIGKKKPEMKLEPEKRSSETIKEDKGENYQVKHLVRIP